MKSPRHLQHLIIMVLACQEWLISDYLEMSVFFDGFLQNISQPRVWIKGRGQRSKCFASGHKNVKVKSFWIIKKRKIKDLILQYTSWRPSDSPDHVTTSQRVLHHVIWQYVHISDHHHAILQDKPSDMFPRTDNAMDAPADDPDI